MVFFEPALASWFSADLERFLLLELVGEDSAVELSEESTVLEAS